MLFAWTAAFLFFSQSMTGARSGAPAAAELRARLAAYEHTVADAGRQDPAALSEIARLVIEAARRAPEVSSWSEACASTFIPESENCDSRLRAVLNRGSETAARRAEAGGALMARGDTAAADALAGWLKSVPVSALAPLAPIIALMPPTHAVPLLVRLAKSPSTADQSAACKVLGAFDRPEARDALARLVELNAPGTETWLLCMVARARLREPGTTQGLWGYGHSLQGDGLLYATRVMLEVGDQESAVQVLTDLTHRGSMRSRLDAAELLVDRKPEVAAPVVELAEADPDVRVR